MNTTAPERGIVLVCAQDGTVQRVLRDDLGLSRGIHVGSALSEMVDAGVREKLGAFMAELHTRNAAYDWEITVPVDGVLLPLHFAGARIDVSGYLIVAAGSRQGLGDLDEQLIRINNEQTNLIRATSKDLSRAVGKALQRDEAVYEELTRVNNEMANLQRELAKKNAELEQLNEQKNRLLGMAAHDLRTPLGVILSYSEFLETEAALVLNAEQREFVATIKEQSEFMLHLVSDLLDVSAIESGELKLNRQPADLVRLIQHNLTLNRVLASRKKIVLAFEPPSASPALTFDPGKIDQVLNNLIGNALKFSHPDTRVTVRLESSPKAVTISVQDQGQGIPAADLARLFKPFSTASVRSTAGEPSTGLGLAIVRRIVESHGGRIWVESLVGQGSTFIFTLPVALVS